MEVFKPPNVKVEPISDEENALLDVKVLKNEARKSSLSMTRKAASPEERSSFTVFDFKIKKEKYDEELMEAEVICILKTYHSVSMDNYSDICLRKHLWNFLTRMNTIQKTVKLLCISEDFWHFN
ncbi:uncharacterized protein LOC111089447, partial [Limulus polyphemus]|uniref:Uncharacterized protein LOC111089447 n=1 Tax=Limulus polyphemus TaxID=6850 RepID=A0ABM1TP77_LIMPO